MASNILNTSNIKASYTPVARRVVYLPRTSPPPNGVGCLVDWVPDTSNFIVKALNAQDHM